MVPMETSEWLSIRSKRKYLQKMRWRYARPRRRRYKSRPIEELMALCGYRRKHAIGLLNGRGRPRLLKRSGPKPVYPPKQVQLVLERIWFESGQLLRETTPSGAARVAARITRKNTARSLYRLKRSWQTSVRRRLIGCFLRCEPKRGQKGRRGNQPSRWLKNQIPLQTD